MAMLDRQEFIIRYLERSKLTQFRIAEGYLIPGCTGRIALKCNCGEKICEGWAMVSDDPESIELHNRLYGDGSKILQNPIKN